MLLPFSHFLLILSDVTKFPVFTRQTHPEFQIYVAKRPDVPLVVDAVDQPALTLSFFFLFCFLDEKGSSEEQEETYIISNFMLSSLNLLFN